MQTAYDLTQAADGGVIREDVLNQIYQIDPEDLPLTERMTFTDMGNPYASWRIRDLAAANKDNAQIDGKAGIVQDDTRVGTRVGNWSQILYKQVSTSTLADASDTIGYSVEHTDQLVQRQKEIRRDREASFTSGNASVQDDGSATAGKLAGISAWATTHTDRGTAGSDGGYGATTPQIVDAPTYGNARAGNEDLIRDICEDMYVAGANPTLFMSIPKAIRRFSEYCHTTNARIATLQSDTGQSADASTAKGAVNVYVTDFDTVLQLQANRFQPAYQSADLTDGCCDLFILDTSLIEGRTHRPWISRMKGNDGLQQTSELFGAYSLQASNEKGIGVISSVDPTLPFVAGP